VNGITDQREEQGWHDDFYPEIRWFASHLIYPHWGKPKVAADPLTSGDP
jgi:hypothetical protein